jgi:hypothetical protein
VTNLDNNLRVHHYQNAEPGATAATTAATTPPALSTDVTAATDTQAPAAGDVTDASPSVRPSSRAAGRS